MGWLRFFLALLVLHAHTNTLGSLLRLPPPFDQMYQAEVGVTMFFVLSGYIIAYVTTEIYNRNPIGFAVNRALRIYPLYILSYLGAVLILSLGVTPVRDLPPFANEGLSWVDYLQGLSIFGALADHNALKPNEPSWTIVAEMVFYAVVFFALLLIGRARQLFLLVACLFCIAMYFTYPFAWLFFENVPGTFIWGVYFATGWLSYSITAGNREPSALLLYVACLILSCLQFLHVKNAVYHLEPLRLDVGAVLALVAFVLLNVVLLALSSFSLDGIWRRIDAFLGDFSYPIYIMHLPLLQLYWWLWPGRTEANWYLSLVFLFGAFWLAVVLTEKPMKSVRAMVRGMRLSDFRGATVISRTSEAPRGRKRPPAQGERPKLREVGGR